MVRFLDRLYDKFKSAAGAGDELIEAAPKESASDESDKQYSNNVGGSPPELIEGTDYYWEGAYMVLTEHYLLNRGYCCASGCRHCPYGFTKTDDREDSETG